MHFVSTFKRTVAILGLAFLAAAAANAQNSSLRSDLSRSFSRFDVSRAEVSRLGGGEVRLKVVRDGSLDELVLEKHDIRAPGYRAENTTPAGVEVMQRAEVETYRGYISGEQNSSARLSIRGGKVEGYFVSSGERFYVEPATKYSPNATAADVVIYRAEDSLKKNDFLCDSDIPAKIEYGKALAASAGENAVSSLRTIEIATEADSAYVATLGGANAANAEILGILNMVEGSYENDITLNIRVTYQHNWTSADPFTGSTTATLLTSFQGYWNANNTGVQRDVAHLFTARSFALSQGIAYIGVMCAAPSSSYGLSGYIDWAPGKFLVPAHEIGHNLGAHHADTPESCGNTLMNATLTGVTPMTFCTYSKSEINSFVGS